MPEGPELHISCLSINDCVKGLIFSGKILKSDVSKNPSIDWDQQFYKITAESRGKEMKLLLEECSIDKKTKHVKIPKKISILFRFGMSGCFKLTTADEIPKHSHLRFYTTACNGSIQVLSFVDPRRFGHWEVNATWGSDRGPCPILDYEKFRHNVITNLEDPAFKNKAICEVLLNQKYFNGIGNYLRAEILFRSKIAPFDDAYAVLSQWRDAPALYPLTKIEDAPGNVNDPLYLCHTVCKEVLKLGGGYDVENGRKENGAFEKWLQCYQNPKMKNLTDKNKRTIWFDGEPGPLTPKGSSSRRPRIERKILGTSMKPVLRKTILRKRSLEEKRTNRKILEQPYLEVKRNSRSQMNCGANSINDANLVNQPTRRSPRFSTRPTSTI